MSRWLDIAAQADPVSISDPDTQQEPSKRSEAAPDGRPDATTTPLMMVYDGCRDCKSSEGSESQLEDMRHGFAVNGQPKTWTGNIVKLDDWRGLTEWQKHGPNGRMWCGVCRAWSKDCEHIKIGETS